MKVSYGPPGHKGVSHLVAIGDSESLPHDDAEQTAILASVVTGALGLVIGNPTVRNVGIGGVLALLGASWLRSRRKVEITQPK